MNTKTPTFTTTEIFIEAQQSTTTHLFPNLDPPATSTVPTFTELLAAYNASLTAPEIIWDHLLATTETEIPIGTNEKRDDVCEDHTYHLGHNNTSLSSTQQCVDNEGPTSQCRSVDKGLASSRPSRAIPLK